MRAASLANYFIAGCAASSLLGWIASLHLMAFKVISLLLVGASIMWALGWLADYSLSKLLKIEVPTLQGLLMASAAMLLVGMGIFLCS